MGTWAEGLLDNDCSFDGLGDIKHGVIQDILSLRDAGSNREACGRLAAAIGLLLQLGASYSFSDEAKESRGLIEVLRAHESGFRDHLRADGAATLARVLSGEGEALAQRKAPLPEDIARALHAEPEAPGTLGFRD